MDAQPGHRCLGQADSADYCPAHVHVKQRERLGKTKHAIFAKYYDAEEVETILRLDKSRDVRLDLAVGARPNRTRLLAGRRACTHAAFADDPAGFVGDLLGESVTPEDVLAGRAPAANAPWQRQREIMEALRDQRRVVDRASQSVGKTHIAARVGIWFLYTRAPAIVITTAPNYFQVRDLL